MGTTLEQGSIGDAVLRKEDRKLLLGNGRFVDDIHVPGELHAVFVRSPHAHAGISSIDVSAASSLPGIVGILTGADMEADGIGSIPFMWIINNSDGSPMNQPKRKTPLSLSRLTKVKFPSPVGRCAMRSRPMLMA